MATKRTEIWQKEHKLFGVHLGLFAPPPGLETIPVELHEPQPESPHRGTACRRGEIARSSNTAPTSSS